MPAQQEIAARLAAHGLIARGGFRFCDNEDRPAGPSGRPARSILIVGDAGASYWRHFAQWRTTQRADLPNPLDTWSRAVIGEVADKAGARVLMPNDRPFAPFQQWAARAEAIRSSPLGILIHPDYGLWHAYRGALLFDVEISIQPPERSNHPCALCVGKPCLNACPVAAFSPAGFAYESCLAHVRGPSGAPCREHGCVARNACPVGEEWRYPDEVQAFHQKAFAGL